LEAGVHLPSPFSLYYFEPLFKKREFKSAFKISHIRDMSFLFATQRAATSSRSLSSHFSRPLPVPLCLASFASAPSFPVFEQLIHAVAAKTEQETRKREIVLTISTLAAFCESYSHSPPGSAVPGPTLLFPCS
jgi:hypothetical protein